MESTYLHKDMTTEGYEISRDEEWTSLPRNVVLDTVNTVIACLAVLGNCLVITVMVVRRRQFNSSTNRLILHQSVIDSIAGLAFFSYKVVLVPAISVSIEANVYDELSCRLVYSEVFLWTLMSVSTYNLVVISLERLLATCYPVRYRNSWSAAKLKFAMATPWCIGLIYGSHSLLVFQARPGSCQVVEIGLAGQVLIGVMVLGTEFFAPATIMLYAYIRILIMLTKKLTDHTNAQQNVIVSAKRNVLVTTLLTGIMFALCWLPVELNYADELFFGNGWEEPLPTFCAALVACNMFVNPIIYCFKYELFRSQLKDIVLKRLRRNQVHDGRSVTAFPSNDTMIVQNEQV